MSEIHIFLVSKKNFHLKDSVAMGSPVSSIVENIFMEDFEERVMADAAQIRPKVWNRFVDDVFSIIRRNSVEQFLQHLNKQDKNIVFPVEVEEDGSLPFLDVRLQRTDEGSIKTGVYRKPTYSGRVFAFESHTSQSMLRQ